MAEMKTCPSCGAQLAPDALQGLCPACLLKEAMASNPASGPTIDVPPEAAKSGADLTATPAERFAAPAIADLAKHFPQLEIQTLLGKGGMGAVYKARQVALDRMVALKILPPESGRDPHFAERFTREARALARLNHSHITTVYEFGESGGYFFFLMEYVDGVNLRQALRSKTMTPEQALAIVPLLGVRSSKRYYAGNECECNDCGTELRSVQSTVERSSAPFKLLSRPDRSGAPFYFVKSRERRGSAWQHASNRKLPCSLCPTHQRKRGKPRGRSAARRSRKAIRCAWSSSRPLRKKRKPSRESSSKNG